MSSNESPAKPSTAECEFCGRETYTSRVNRAPTMATEEIATTCLGPRGLEPGPCLDATRARLASLASDNARLRERVTALTKAGARLVDGIKSVRISENDDGVETECDECDNCLERWEDCACGMRELADALQGDAKSEAEAAVEGR